MKRLLLLFGMILSILPAASFGQEQPASKEDLETVKGALDGLNESYTEYRGYIDALRKIKITGYVQPQFRLTDIMNQSYSIGSFSGGAFPSNTKNLFQVRRGRVKVNYDNTLTQFVIQIDAIQTGLALKDAYLAVTEPWMKAFGLQMGVFDRPFGYEISYSSSNRETPERSRLYQTLFPGERELGAKVIYAPQRGPLSMLRADVGVFNGSGPTANEFDNFKDVMGHLALQFPFQDAGAALDLGVSGYFGKVRNDTKFVWKNGESAPGVKGFVVDSSSANLSAGVVRRYLGADVQFYYDVPVLGGLILRGEVVTGVQPGTSDTVRTTTSASPISPKGKSLTTSSPAAQARGPVYKRDFLGWYVYLVQNIGNSNQLVVKYDVYDPNTNVSAGDFSSSGNLSTADIKHSTLGLGWVHHWDENVKFVFYYEFVSNEKLDKAKVTTGSLLPYTEDLRDNVFTFRAQYKF